MVNFVKCLCKVKVNTIKVFTGFKDSGDSFNMGKQVRQRRSSLEEAMLVSWEVVGDFQVRDNGFPENPLKDFYNMGCEGDWSIRTG